MKLVVAIVQEEDRKKLSEAFTEKGVRATRLRSSGGFMRSGNTTFLIGIESSKVDAVLDIIKDISSTRVQSIMAPPSYDFNFEIDLNYPIDVEVGGATVFVLDVEQFKKL
ncbi:MAG: cyclic-di-AMP receptor [Atopostipes sp.]|nr:cyclic-di-AMP receptor [Atopostipes sp.]